MYNIELKKVKRDFLKARRLPLQKTFYGLIAFFRLFVQVNFLFRELILQRERSSDFPFDTAQHIFVESRFQRKQ